MNATTNTNSPLYADSQGIIEIKLWGLYLLLNRSALYDEIVQSSLDQGPVEKYPHSSGRVTFRFDVHAWESRIKKLLYSYRIPVVLKSDLSLGNYRSNAMLTTR